MYWLRYSKDANGRQVSAECRQWTAARLRLAHNRMNSPENAKNAARIRWESRGNSAIGRRAVILESSHIDFRSVGYSDEILPRGIRHTGWLRDEDQCFSVYRGQVWQLPARRGAVRYVCGFVDDDAGSLFLDADNGRILVHDSKEDAASYADSLAEKCAELDREFYNADSMQQAAGEKMRQACESAAEITRISREQRKIGPMAPAVREVLWREMRAAREDLRAALGEMAEANDAMEYAERNSAQWWGK